MATVLTEARRALLERLRPAKRRSMVGWYDPQVLAQSAWFMTIANLFGRHSDTRLIEALATQPQREFEYAANADSGEFWLDYASDIADGWNSTYAVAATIAPAELEVASAAGERLRTRGGEVLVFGGDEVYPYPSKEAYAARAESPYATAFAGARRWPDLFAVPGNHDWFDSLIAFSRTFCRPERGFAGCRTQQTRSYFALRLPRDWWLLGIDLQLGADLDEPQVRYFQDVASRIPDGAHVILCVPDPQWIYEASYAGNPNYTDGVLRFFEDRVLRRKVAVFLTGDLHFYKRHENEAGVQKIVAGGGGAFLHPTHAPDTSRLSNGFVEKACYPAPADSRGLTWRNLAFPLLNPKFTWLPAVTYTLTAWIGSSTLSAADIGSFATLLLASVRGALREPALGIWLVTFVSAFVFFTDTHVRWYRVLGGIGHAIAHLAAAFGLGWLTLELTTRVLGLAFGDIPQMLIAGAILLVGGGILGSVVLGGYLFVSLRVFGRHANEAFSSLRIADFKQFLRLRIERDGRLSIFSIGIDRVPRRWVSSEPDDGPERVESADPRARGARLIEVVALRPRGDGTYAVAGVDQAGRRYGGY
jgi:hypothetical protein